MDLQSILVMKEALCPVSSQQQRALQGWVMELCLAHAGAELFFAQMS